MFFKSTGEKEIMTLVFLFNYWLVTIMAEKERKQHKLQKIKTRATHTVGLTSDSQHLQYENCVCTAKWLSYRCFLFCLTFRKMFISPVDQDNKRLSCSFDTAVILFWSLGIRRTTGQAKRQSALSYYCLKNCLGYCVCKQLLTYSSGRHEAPSSK